MRLAILRKKRKSLSNMLPQTVSCSYSLGGHGTDFNTTDCILVVIIFSWYELVRQYEFLAQFVGHSLQTLAREILCDVRNINIM